MRAAPRFPGQGSAAPVVVRRRNSGRAQHEPLPLIRSQIQRLRSTCPSPPRAKISSSSPFSTPVPGFFRTYSPVCILPLMKKFRLASNHVVTFTITALSYSGFPSESRTPLQRRIFRAGNVFPVQDSTCPSAKTRLLLPR